METKLFPFWKSADLLGILSGRGNMGNWRGGNFEGFFEGLKFPLWIRKKKLED